MDRVDVFVRTNIKGIRKASGAFIWLLEMQSSKGPVTRSEKKSVLNVTGRIAELMALIKALERMTKPCEIMLHVSNSNLAKTIDKGWLDTWAESGFIDAKGEEVKDADRWRRFHELLKQHTLLGVTCEHHTYSSWMDNELGMNTEVPESRINTSYDTILKITELIESLDLSEVDESGELTNAINTLCGAFFEKFKITQNRMISGFVKIENTQSRKSTSYDKNIKNTEADKQGITEEVETANAEK